MTKQQLSSDRVTSAGLDRMMSACDGRTVDVTVVPDSKGLALINGGTTHSYGNGYTVVLAVVRNDGSSESKLSAIELAIASLATAK